MNFQEFKSLVDKYRVNLGTLAIRSLMDEGYNTVEQLRKASDDDLLSLTYVGPTSLKAIRELCELHEDTPQDKSTIPQEELDRILRMFSDARDINGGDHPMDVRGLSETLTLTTGKELKFKGLDINYPTHHGGEERMEFLDGCRQYLRDNGYETLRLKVNGDIILFDGGKMCGFIAMAGSTGFDYINTFNDDVIKCIEKYFQRKKKEFGTEHVNRVLVKLFAGEEIVDRVGDTVISKGPEEYTKTFYPYFDQTVEEVWDGFAKSTANVLLLIGPPGVGKSSFLKQLLHYQGWSRVDVVDDQNVIEHRKFTNYLKELDHGSVCVIEDGDNVVKKREQGNGVMSTLLNVADGVIQKGGKIIISTNLPTLRDVDPALIRPGRCYRVLEFKHLTLDQAKRVRESMGLDTQHMDVTKTDWTLSEAINLDDVGADSRKANTFGFV